MLIVDFYPPLVSNEESCNPVEPDRDEAIGVQVGDQDCHGGDPEEAGGREKRKMGEDYAAEFPTFGHVVYTLK